MIVVPALADPQAPSSRKPGSHPSPTSLGHESAGEGQLGGAHCAHRATDCVPGTRPAPGARRPATLPAARIGSRPGRSSPPTPAGRAPRLCRACRSRAGSEPENGRRGATGTPRARSWGRDSGSATLGGSQDFLRQRRTQEETQIGEDRARVWGVCAGARGEGHSGGGVASTPPHPQGRILWLAAPRVRNALCICRGLGFILGTLFPTPSPAPGLGSMLGSPSPMLASGPQPLPARAALVGQAGH